MNETELKHVIAMLLEDAKRLQQVEPNAGTEARIWVGRNALQSDDNDKAVVNKPHVATTKISFVPNDSSFKRKKISPLTCEGVNRIYHETMVAVLRMEIEKLESIIHGGVHSVTRE
ncbi:hypothetical protein HYF16_000230 [Salmonella enterica]|nr:hypothetical protein [Salmonella enterica]